MNNATAYDNAQRSYDGRLPEEYWEEEEKEVLSDNESLLETCYEYIQAMEMTDTDVKQLDQAFLALPDFLLNVKKWHKNKGGFR